MRTAVSQTRSKNPLNRSIQIFGELLITVGLILLLFVAWQLWWTNLEANATQDNAVHSLSQEFEQKAQETISHAQATWGPNSPEVTSEPGHGEAFGIAYIPRFGETYRAH
ncbi:hypothetical protein [uncultured Rothia sp.]|uniref:hypothetical protein n=1 Tax=uncultured Rothia sp. TaxID=316088 RepID=UPI003217A78D